MDANERICMWLGWEPRQAAIMPSPTRWWHDPSCPNETVRVPTPDFCEHDSAAITLLPVLVDKYGHEGDLKYRKKLSSGKFQARFWCRTANDGYDSDWCDTISAAICTAIIQLIDKEGGDERTF